jgi:hypothetical protein
MIHGGLFAPIGRLPNMNLPSNVAASWLGPLSHQRVIALGRCSHRTRRGSRRPSPRKSVGIFSATSFGEIRFRAARSCLSTLFAADPPHRTCDWTSLSRKRAMPLTPHVASEHRAPIHSAEARVRLRLRRKSTRLGWPEPYVRHPGEGMTSPRLEACSTVSPTRGSRRG